MVNVLITGGNGGIGSSIKELYLEKSYKVFSPNSKELNLANKDSIVKFFMNDENKYDIFIHCAGLNNPQLFLELDEENLLDTLEINTISSIRILKNIIPGMEKKRFGRIIFISSLWSKWAKVGRIAYSMSKSSLDALTRGLALEYANKNILVNSVLPGFVDTDLTRKNLSQKQIEEIKIKTPMNKLVSPKDIAKTTYFLGSDENNSITGQSIVIDGGYTL